MKYTYLLIFLILLFRSSISQTLITNDSIKLKIGIYKDFYELKYNNPTIPFKDLIKQKLNYNNNDFLKTKNYTIYKLVLSKDTKKLIKHPFGFCDGVKVYICNKRLNCDEIYYLGKLCYYKTLTRTTGGYFGQNIQPSYSTILSDNILDINSGISLSLTKSFMNDLLIHDSTLLEDYNINYKTTNIGNFIIKYSGNNNEEIYLKDFDLNNNIQMNTSDSTFDNYYLRIKSLLIDNPRIKDIKKYDLKNKKGNYKETCIQTTSTDSPVKYLFIIGTRRLYWKNGLVKMETFYDINGLELNNKNYDKNGKVIKIKKNIY